MPLQVAEGAVVVVVLFFYEELLLAPHDPPLLDVDQVLEGILLILGELRPSLDVFAVVIAVDHLQELLVLKFNQGVSIALNWETFQGRSRAD